MKIASKPTADNNTCQHLSAKRLRELLAVKEEEQKQQETELTARLKQQEAEFTAKLKQQENLIKILEEQLRLAQIRIFATKSEKLPPTAQIHLFDEAELETELEALDDQLSGDDENVAKPRPKQRQRGFSPKLTRKRVELLLPEAEKAGASRTFFTKVKEELDYIPARMIVLEYWQEKAVFTPATAEENDTDTGRMIAAPRPTHPLGKCQASVSLLTQIIINKYADGLPLYRQESIFKRTGADISRTAMAHWIIRLGDDGLKPLINLLREHQNSSDYLQGDETRIQVLKETGKTAQSDKWMWVVRGGPPDQPVVLFEYDPSRAGTVPERLLDDFDGIFQTDGYSGYAAVCLKNGIIRIGCWDHARRKFVEAVKAAEGKKARGKPSKADIALGMIGQLYRIEDKIKDKTSAGKYQLRQELSVPVLNKLKVWLDENAPKMMKGGLTRKAMDYCLNQWEYLIGYCQRGDLHISNVLAENAIRPFAVGRKAWLFADTPHGARASATLYSLVETAKANQLDPYAYIRYILEHIGEADTLEKWEALLPWNVPLEKIEKNRPDYE